MADQHEVADKLLDAIARAAETTNDATRLLKLAEAYAWVVSPSQSHGGSGS